MSAKRKRHRVVKRPKVRSRQLKQQAAIIAVGVLGLIAAISARQIKVELPSWQASLARIAPLGELVLEGAPEGWEPQISACLAEKDEGMEEKVSRLQERFPFFKPVRAQRLWLRRKAQFHLELRKAVARVAGPGPRFLSDDGVVFSGPESLYREALPLADFGGAGRGAEFAAFLAEADKIGGAPTRIVRARYSAAQRAWELSFEDGTQVVWGTLSWTQEKFRRLSQVLEDSRQRDPSLAPPLVDMRYFEDGKILLKTQAPIKVASIKTSARPLTMAPANR